MEPSGSGPGPVIAAHPKLTRGWQGDTLSSVLLWSLMAILLSARWRWALGEDGLHVCGFWWWGDTKWWQNCLPAISVLKRSPGDSAVTKFNHMTLNHTGKEWLLGLYLLLRKAEAWPWTGSTTYSYAAGKWQMIDPQFHWFSCRCHKWLFLFVCSYITSFFLIKLGCIWVSKPQLKVILCFPWNTNEHRCDWNYQGLSRVAKMTHFSPPSTNGRGGALRLGAVKSQVQNHGTASCPPHLPPSLRRGM